jgi:hypothetical protein
MLFYLQFPSCLQSIKCPIRKTQCVYFVFFTSRFSLNKCVNFKSKNVHYYLKYYMRKEQLNGIQAINLNFCKCIDWNNINKTIFKLKHLTDLNILQIDLKADDLYAILDEFRSLERLEFTQPVHENGNRLIRLSNLTRLRHLCIDLIKGGNILQVIVDKASTSLETLVLVSIRKLTSYEPFKLNLCSSKQLKTLIIKNPNILIKNIQNEEPCSLNALIERLTCFQINIEYMQLNAANLNCLLNSNHVKQVKLSMYTLNRCIPNYRAADEVLTLDFSLFSNRNRNLLTINNKSYAISAVLYDMKTLNDCQYLSVLDLKSVHIHTGYSLCEILSRLPRKRSMITL